MDKNGILIPLSFLVKNYGVHFTISDKNVLSLSKNQIVEWRYSGYCSKKPYLEYESMYLDGVKTTKTRITGKSHVFKNIIIYNKKTGQSKTIAENKINLYKPEWSTTPPKASNSGTSSKNTINSFFTRMNTHRFFQSSTFNTWGGQMIRRFAP